jgi:SAM-dependent methyltransferase
MKIIKKNIVEFRFISKEDLCDEKYINWSRKYEYPIIIDKIKKSTNKNLLIHNTACGFAPIHEQFAKEIDKLGKCIHSDILYDSSIQQYYYDLRNELKEFENKFDYVLNISTLEHIKNLEIQVLENLYKQVKKGGYLICTFDYPTVDLKKIEQFLNYNCQEIYNKLVNNNLQLNIVLLILQKT